MHSRPTWPGSRPDPVLVRGVGTPLREQLHGHASDAHRARGQGAPPDALVDALVAAYLDHNRARHDAEIRPFPDALATLTRLRMRASRWGS
ncbi:MAG: hypothetical protein R3F43_18890 [bacterium]